MLIKSRRRSNGAIVTVALLALLGARGLAARPHRAGRQESATADAVESHVGKGYEYVQKERFREAAREFRAALTLNPNLPRARYQLAISLLAIGQHKESREEFDRLNRETSGDPAVLYYLGRLDLLEEKVDSAIRHLESAASAPPFPDFAYYLGNAYLKKGELPAAEKWLKIAAEKDPRDFRVHDHLARLFQRSGQREKAEEEYAISSRLRQSYNEASRQSVECSRELETLPLDQARPTCRRLFAPDDPDRLTTLGMLYGQHGYFEEALEPFERAAQLDHDSFEIEHNLGVTYFRLKHYKGARAHLEKAVALRPDFFGSNALLGAALFALGMDAPAFQALDKAHHLDPHDTDTANLLFKVAGALAREKFDKKEYDLCLEYLKAAAELSPSEVDVHRRMAEVYRLLGRRDEASRERQEAERLSAARP